MTLSEKQTTLAGEVTLSGIGLHTAKKVNMTLKPAEANQGYRFVRIDLEGNPVLPADVNKVVSTNRGTTLESQGVSVATVEHLLSALSGNRVDNAIIEVDGPEIPILDGSAGIFSDEIKKVGVNELEAEREYLELTDTIKYFDEETGSELMAIPAEEFEITTLIDFNSKVLGLQYAKLDHIESFHDEIANCRTFVFAHELENLLDQGLIKGGDLDNAVVIANKKISDAELQRLSKKLGKENISINKEGVLNTTDLLFQNEPARHKLLDVIGDLALIGAPLRARVVANKPGHKANTEFAKLLKKKLVEQRKLKGKPEYDPDRSPLMDVERIKRMIPHRYPFLLVDKIIEISDSHVVGVKNVTFNESFFQGHFPGNPVFPGVLQIEALAQTGGILALSGVDDPENWDTYFVKIDQVKFKKKVVPGDTLILKLELLAPIRRGIVQMSAIAYVGNSIVSEGQLTAQIIKRNRDE
ncbi:MAG: bifunctional UDP-3-O-[3-hydroxymyristoyl] N-acetylglucosamine deacetylase/3-hydroxyacyl-ACP dehydratase [Saprospiraceae bacterium]|nr:bifunctional UDP-3-O-[3-hydroxymyristoyl] N-acetylglucosamine deacetylase/3-hydroxyacyl-ACP dehydratase [Saprospiraceae bacterium]